MHDHLIQPHGGTLVDLMASDERIDELRGTSRDWPSWDLTPRQECDLELLLCGGFSPLTGFMKKADFDSVCDNMRLADGTLWPVPVTLDVTEEAAEGLKVGDVLGLRDPEGLLLAGIHVEEIWTPDPTEHCEKVYGTSSPDHPGVAHILERTNKVSIGGRVEGLHLPKHHDFRRLRETPADLRTWAARRGWRQIVAFQTRNPMHRAHYELTLRAAKELGANLLVHPVVGMTKPGDLDHFTRVRCYQALMGRYPQPTTKLSLLPLAMRMAGTRARPCGTPSSARTTAAPTSSSAATTLAPVTIPRASPSTVPTTPRISCASTRKSSASRWCPSSSWCTSKSKTNTCPSTKCPKA